LGLEGTVTVTGAPNTYIDVPELAVAGVRLKIISASARLHDSMQAQAAEKTDTAVFRMS
jgi:hypothetical protein